MGHVYVQVTLSNPTNPALQRTAEAMVDTDATFTIVPKALADELQLPITGKTRVRTAAEPVGLARARAMVQINGSSDVNPVLISETLERVLIGVITLETLSLSVDPTSGELREAEAFLY